MSWTYQVNHSLASSAYTEGDSSASPAAPSAGQDVSRAFMGLQVEEAIFFTVIGTSGSRSDEHSLCVSFTEDPLPTLHAPTTEIVWITAKTGAFTDKVVTALDRLAGFGNDPHSPTIGTAYGKVLDEPGMFLVLMGWTSVEEHYSTREDKAYKLGEIATELMGLADVKLAHVHFRAA